MLVKNKKGTHIYWVPRGCPASINTNNKNRLRTEYLRGKEKMFSALWLHLTQHTLINTTPPDSTWNGIECELSVPSFTLAITRVLFKVIFISVNKSIITVHQWGFPDGASGKEPTCQCRRHKRFRCSPWVGKIPWRRTQPPLQYSWLENPMDRGAWWATVHRFPKSWIWLSDKAQHSTAAARIPRWGKLRLREVNLPNIIYLIASEIGLGLERSPLSSNTNLVLFW